MNDLEIKELSAAEEALQKMDKWFANKARWCQGYAGLLTDGERVGETALSSTDTGQVRKMCLSGGLWHFAGGYVAAGHRLADRFLTTARRALYPNYDGIPSLNDLAGIEAVRAVIKEARKLARERREEGQVDAS